MGKDLLDLVHAVMILLVPFLFGVAVGAELVRRRPKSTDQLFGELMRQRILGVYSQRQWVGCNGTEISSSFKLDMPEGRVVEVIVREVA